jgi:hypothetical protein
MSLFEQISITVAIVGIVAFAILALIESYSGWMDAVALTFVACVVYVPVAALWWVWTQ